MKRIFVFLVFVVSMTACGQQVVPQNTDWCYVYNFATSNTFNVVSGNWVDELGYTTDSTGLLQLQYTYSTIVVPRYVEVYLRRPVSVTGDVSLASAGHIYGVNANHSGTIPVTLNEVTVTFEPSIIGDGSSIINVTVEVYGGKSVVVERMIVRGYGATPFPSNPCAPITPTATGIANTATATPTLTSTATGTPPTVTSTPSCTTTFSWNFLTQGGGIPNPPVFGKKGVYASSTGDFRDTGGSTPREVYIDVSVNSYVSEVRFSRWFNSGGTAYSEIVFDGVTVASSSAQPVSSPAFITWTGYTYVSNVRLRATHVGASVNYVGVRQLSICGYTAPLATLTPTITPTPTLTPTATRTPLPTLAGTATRTPVGTPNTPTPTVSPTTSPTLRCVYDIDNVVIAAGSRVSDKVNSAAGVSGLHVLRVVVPHGDYVTYSAASVLTNKSLFNAHNHSADGGITVNSMSYNIGTGYWETFGSFATNETQFGFVLASPFSLYEIVFFSNAPLPNSLCTSITTTTPTPMTTGTPHPVATATVPVVGTPSSTGDNGIIDSVTNGFNTLFEYLGNIARDIGLAIENAVTSLIDAIGGFFSSIQALIQNIFDAIAYAIAFILALIYTLIRWILALVEIVWLVLQIILGLISLLIQWLIQLINRLAALVGAFFNATPIAIAGLPQCVTAPLQNDICAIYYIMDWTVFAPDTPGSLIMPLVLGFLGVAFLFRFARIVLSLINKGSDLE